jgi:hypothetical protein
VFASYDATVDHCCHAWKKLVAHPWKIMSLGPPGMGTRVLISERSYYVANRASCGLMVG